MYQPKKKKEHTIKEITTKKTGSFSEKTNLNKKYNTLKNKHIAKKQLNQGVFY